MLECRFWFIAIKNAKGEDKYEEKVYGRVALGSAATLVTRRPTLARYAQSAIAKERCRR